MLRLYKSGQLVKDIAETLCLDLVAVGSYLRSRGVDTGTNASVSQSRSNGVDVQLSTLVMRLYSSRDNDLGASEFTVLLGRAVRYLNEVATKHDMTYEEVRKLFIDLRGEARWLDPVCALLVQAREGDLPSITDGLTKLIREAIDASTYL